MTLMKRKPTDVLPCRVCARVFVTEAVLSQTSSWSNVRCALFPQCNHALPCADRRTVSTP